MIYVTRVSSRYYYFNLILGSPIVQAVASQPGASGSIPDDFKFCGGRNVTATGFTPSFFDFPLIIITIALVHSTVPPSPQVSVGPAQTGPIESSVFNFGASSLIWRPAGVYSKKVFFYPILSTILVRQPWSKIFALYFTRSLHLLIKAVFV
jgi:hypothetical protein